MKVNLQNVLSRIEAVYQCGEKEDGTHTRMAFSKEDVKARNLMVEWGKGINMTHRIDSAGNLILHMDGRIRENPAILMGSHMDTVPDGGRYDGVLGCIGALGVCEAMHDAGYVPEHPIEIIVFTDEEGFRFGKGLLGSSSICGIDTEISDEDLDIYGDKRGDVMKSYGISSANVMDAEIKKDAVHCFVELHIEQGPILYKTGRPIGVVSSIAGVNRYEITVTGEANHAGSTTMADRKDALVAAAEFIGSVPEITTENGNQFTVATVGTIDVTPYSVNVIPGTCTFSLEIRDQDKEVMRLIEEKLHARLKDVCRKRNVKSTFTATSGHNPAPMSLWVQGAIERAAERCGYSCCSIPSGAFHDSLVMTESFPTGMIFVPSVNGISHSKDELTLDEDIEKGVDVLLETILEMDRSEK